MESSPLRLAQRRYFIFWTSRRSRTDPEWPCAPTHTLITVYCVTKTRGQVQGVWYVSFWYRCLFNQSSASCVSSGSSNKHTSTIRPKNTEKSHGQTKHPRIIGTVEKRKICISAVYSVALDLLSLSFADDHAGMPRFVRAAFEAGQATPVGDKIYLNGVRPSTRAVRDSLTTVASQARNQFRDLLKHALEIGGGMKNDGLTMKVQEKHMYDLTLVYFEFGKLDAFGEVKPRMRCHILVLAEAGDSQTAANIRLLRNNSLLWRYQFELDTLASQFTLVTDYCAVLPKIVGTSVSSNVSPFYVSERFVNSGPSAYIVVLNHGSQPAHIALSSILVS